MANYDIRPLQLRILKNLLAVDKVCKEHNLRYYIMAGTMLGAVRHKGFIPWDDDLDIGMPRADYDLLMANAKEWLPKQIIQRDLPQCLGRQRQHHHHTQQLIFIA